MSQSVAVIGTTFVDCKGFAGQRYNPFGRNLGNIRFVHGGVGRNVAENLALLNIPTMFVSTVDNSALADEVVKRLLKAGANVDYLSRAGDKGMGVWLAILDQRGDLVGSISQMPDLALLEDFITGEGERIIQSVEHVALEIDLNERISRTVIEIARGLNKRVYGIPGNLEVVMNHRGLLRHTQCFICNDIEAGQLKGSSLEGAEIEELKQVVVDLATALELPSMVITLGERGSVYYDAGTGARGYQPVFPTEVVDSSGAGDAFFSGTVMGLIRNRPLEEAVIYGTRVASWTLQKEENTSPDLSRKARGEALFERLFS